MPVWIETAILITLLAPLAAMVGLVILAIVCTGIEHLRKKSPGEIQATQAIRRIDLTIRHDNEGPLTTCRPWLQWLAAIAVFVVLAAGALSDGGPIVTTVLGAAFFAAIAHGLTGLATTSALRCHKAKIANHR